MSPADCGDATAYALRVLDAEDSAAFEGHLLGCPDCQRELLELQQVHSPLAELRRR